jgi:hypothetical protein
MAAGNHEGQRSQMDPRDLELDIDYKAWDFVIIYRMRNLLERQRHFLSGCCAEGGLQMHSYMTNFCSPLDGLRAGTESVPPVAAVAARLRVPGLCDRRAQHLPAVDPPAISPNASFEALAADRKAGARSTLR